VFCLSLLADELVASTIHQRFVSRLPSFEQELGEELFVSGLVGPYRVFQRKNGHRHGIDDATTAGRTCCRTSYTRDSLGYGKALILSSKHDFFKF
jgi:hypothetical protein